MTKEQLETGNRIDSAIKHISQAIIDVKMDGFYDTPTWFVNDIVIVAESAISSLKKQFEEL